MYADGRFENEVIGFVVDSVVCRPGFTEDWNRLKEIFTNPSLQIASFTITEKGYKLTNYDFPAVAEDMKNGPEKATSSMGCIAALAYARYKAGTYPFAFLSMDNCSHNGDKIKAAMTTFADAWVKNGVAGDGFAVGFTSGLLDGLTLEELEEAARRGAAIGAMAIQVAGDNEGLPTRKQLKEFQDTHQ